MEIKKIVEGMTASKVAKVIDDKFREVDTEKAEKVDLANLSSTVSSNKSATDKQISDLSGVVSSNKSATDKQISDLSGVVSSNKTESDEKLLELGSYVGKVPIRNNMLYSVSASTQTGGFLTNENYQCVLFPIIKTDGNILDISGGIFSSIIYFDSDVLDTYIYTGTSKAVPDTAKYCAINFKKEDNPDGLDNLVISQSGGVVFKTDYNGYIKKSDYKMSSSININDITNLFLKDRYFSNGISLKNLSNRPLSLNNCKCILLKVEEGNEIICTNIKGGSSGARAFVKYDSEGNVLSYADKSVTINETIVIDYDGYIVLNHYSNEDFKCLFNGNIPSYLSSYYIASLTEAANKIIGIENSIIYYKEIEEGFVWGEVYTFAVGEEPVKVENVSYASSTVSGLKAGDYVVPNIKVGSSYKSYATIKDGLVVKTGSAAIAVTTAIQCDGTFDSIIFNNYKGYISAPTVVSHRKTPINEAVQELNKEDSIIENKSINILCFGNSFTQDCMSYVPFILKNIAPNLNLTLAIAYIGGCPLVQHCANLTGESMALGSDQYDLRDYVLQLYKEERGKWSSEGSMNADDILAYDDWDIITFQQNGDTSDGDWATYYEPYIYKIHKAIAEKVSKPIKLGWLSVHGSYKSTFEDLYNKWEGTVENSQKIQNLTGNQIVFPFGTAVQNLRTTPLVNLGDGGFLMGDSAHLHDGIGCLAAAYANALKILEVSGYGIHSIIGEKTRPTKEWISEKGIPSPNYGAVTNDVVGITEDNCYTAQIAAIMAVKKPFEVTDCSKFYKEQ